ncbi:MAG: FIVAR domain-containing protein, partial [Oscillospiraceae bacterium]|nr:FIVAR domain-containing protein [Oscillospiraceae bacterium]
AIATAQAVYDTNPTEETVILAAVAELKAAVVALPKLELNTAITAVANYVENDYASDSWAAFAQALRAAQTVAAKTGAAQTEIDEALAALNTAIGNLALKGETVSKSALEAKIAEAEAIARENETFSYTETSFAALQSAITAAQTVCDNADATQLQVNSQITALGAAIAALRVETTELEDAIAEARDIDADDYEESSYAALQAAIAAAEALQDEAEAMTSERMAAQIASLASATDALAPKAALKYRLADGDYAIPGKTALFQFAAVGESMGNPAIDHSKSYITISDDGAQARVHLFFGPLTAHNLTGYLLTLDVVTKIYYDATSTNIVDHYDVETAQVHEDWGAAHDDFWKQEYGPYPKHLSIPVTLGQQDTTVHVFVPVMASISAASGDQLARLRIDWSGFDLTGSAETADTEELTAAIAGIPANTGDKYTPESYAALTASVAAGEYLIESNAALTVTAELVAARIAAIGVAKNALIALPVKVEVAPVAPTVTVDAENSGKATATVGTEAITEAIAAAKKDDSNDGAEIENAVIEKITLNAVPTGEGAGAVKEVAVSIPVEAVAAVKEENAAIVIDAGDVGSVTLARAEVAKIAAAQTEVSGEENTAVTITISADATGDLTEAQQNSIAIPEGKTPFAVTLKVGDDALTGIAVEVTMAYAKTGGANKQVVVWQVKANGDKIKCEVAYEDGKVTFTATI